MSFDPTDDDTFDGPSRSQLRREALAVFALAEALVALPDAELVRMPLDADLVDEVRRARAVSQQIARKRQVQFLAKQMRRLDEDALAPLRAALAHDRAQMRRAAADLHHVERWRDRLLADGDDGCLLAYGPMVY
ncbi:MAG TPA: ribosome biogenesis factor YjgA, partial [Dokdonella sp.]|nr:ribosome biogenesis factor YjgA [Dokdonella sp.]